MQLVNTNECHHRVVLLVKHVLDGVTLGRFACKRIPVGDDHQWLENVLLEVTLLQNISNENLVSYRYVDHRLPCTDHMLRSS